MMNTSTMITGAADLPFLAYAAFSTSHLFFAAAAS